MGKNYAESLIHNKCNSPKECGLCGGILEFVQDDVRMLTGLLARERRRQSKAPSHESCLVLDARCGTGESS